MQKSQQVRYASAGQDFQKDYVPMDFDSPRASQPDFQYKKKNKNSN